MWHALTLLHYLDLADGTPLLGKMMAFAQYPDGMVRGGGFDRRAELVIRRQLGLLPPEELRRRCAEGRIKGAKQVRGIWLIPQ